MCGRGIGVESIGGHAVDADIVAQNRDNIRRRFVFGSAAAMPATKVSDALIVCLMKSLRGYLAHCSGHSFDDLR